MGQAKQRGTFTERKSRAIALRRTIQPKPAPVVLPRLAMSHSDLATMFIVAASGGMGLSMSDQIIKRNS